MTERDEMTRPPTGTTQPVVLAGRHRIPVLAGRIGQSLTGAVFTLHHCDRSDPLYPLGGARLTLVPTACGSEPAAARVPRVTHNMLLPGGRLRAACPLTGQVMNGALGSVLRALGWDVRASGTGGAWIISLPEGHDAEGATR